ELQIGGVILGSELRSPHILQADQRSVSVGLEDDVVKLRSLTESPHGAHAHLVLLSGPGRLLADLAGRNFYVLLSKRIYDMRRGKTASRHAYRIEPKPHRVLALPEHENISHSRDALERVPDVHVKVVAHEQGGVFVVVSGDGRAKNEILRSLDRRDPDILDRRWEAAQCRIDAILYVDGRDVGIAIQIKGHPDAARSVVATGRGHVLHSLGAVDLLLQRNRDRAFYRLRARTNVEAGNAHLRRSQVGKLRNRQRGNHRCARQNNQQRAYRSKDRTLDEEVNEHM